ncbi:MAG: hypothetical protein KA120_06035 [Candidatus Goldbacteria bacterium]|nr:hypothetical protein [Candidatus Goldiibacteriota bacterium]
MLNEELEKLNKETKKLEKQMAEDVEKKLGISNLIKTASKEYDGRNKQWKLRQ